MLGAYPKGNFAILAIQQGRPGILRLLADEDIDVGVSNPSHENPLHEVMKQHKTYGNKENTLEMMRVVMGSGCREDLVNSQGQTFMTYAVEN